MEPWNILIYVFFISVFSQWVNLADLSILPECDLDHIAATQLSYL